jgi:predicted RNA polymerase sigma factor
MYVLIVRTYLIAFDPSARRMIQSTAQIATATIPHENYPCFMRKAAVERLQAVLADADLVERALVLPVPY